MRGIKLKYVEMLRQSWEKYNGVESVVRTKRSKTEDNDNTSRVEEGEISFCVKKERNGMESSVVLIFFNNNLCF